MTQQIYFSSQYLIIKTKINIKIAISKIMPLGSVASIVPLNAYLVTYGKKLNYPNKFIEKNGQVEINIDSYCKKVKKLFFVIIFLIPIFKVHIKHKQFLVVLKLAKTY